MAIKRRTAVAEHVEIQEQLRISEERAAELVDRFEEKYPDLVTWRQAAPWQGPQPVWEVPNFDALKVGDTVSVWCSKGPVGLLRDEGVITERTAQTITFRLSDDSLRKISKNLSRESGLKVQRP